MKIRIGNDFRYNWLILWNEEAEIFTDVTDKRLTVTVYGRVTELMEGTDYTITGNTIAIDFTPAICDKTGSYNLAFHYTKPSDKFIDGDRRSAVDVDAFIIVPKTEQSDALEDITQTSDAVATFLDIAYQKLDAIEASEELRETAEAGRITSEGLRVTAETGRTTAEGVRVTNEQGRIAAEVLRQTNIQDAIDAAALANTKAGEADTAAGLANTAAEQANTARTNLTTDVNTKLSEADQKIGEMNDTLSTYDGRVTQVESDISQLAGDVSVKVANLIVNGDFSNGSAGWAIASPTVATITDKVIFNGLATNNNGVYTDVPVVGNAKLYLTYKASNEGVPFPQIRLFNYNSFDNSTATDFSQTVSSGVFDSLLGGVRIYFRQFSGSTYINATYDNIMLINLTSIFGAGNEPTKTEMDTLISILGVDYFDGEITIPAQKVMQWQLKMIRQNRSAIIALGGTII